MTKKYLVVNLPRDLNIYPVNGATTVSPFDPLTTPYAHTT
jgi:hypothetical protein